MHAIWHILQRYIQKSWGLSTVQLVSNANKKDETGNIEMKWPAIDFFSSTITITNILENYEPSKIIDEEIIWWKKNEKVEITCHAILIHILFYSLFL